MWIQTAPTLLRQYRRIASLTLHLRTITNQVTVEPYCKIHVKTSCPLVLRPFDLLGNPAGNQIKATLAKNQTQLDIRVEEGENQQVVSISEKLTEFIGQDEILLEVPVQVDLAIEGGESVSVSDIEGDSIEVLSLTGIRTKNIKGDEIKLFAGHGGVHCQGTVLAKKLTVRSEQEGVS